MDTVYYLDKFQHIGSRLDKELLRRHNMEYRVGEWLHSPVLKMQKRSWMAAGLKEFEHSVFFSIWVSDDTLKSNKLYYNIHALQLRSLTGYSIKSREFAAAFRIRFAAFAQKWPNVRVDFGPQTLMEGWIAIDALTLDQDVRDLAGKFLEIEGIIDQLFAERKKY